MNIEQRKWILTKASQLIEKYVNFDKLSETDYQSLQDDVKKITDKSKNNKECSDLMLSILTCFEGEEQWM